MFLVNQNALRATVVAAATFLLSAASMAEMNVNEDGSVDIFFAPNAPEGQEANWISTGEDFFLLFRLYGPSEGWIESGWKLPDVEKVK